MRTGFYGTVALVAGRMTGHRGRFLALVTGLLLLTGVMLGPAPAIGRAKIHKAGDAGALAGRGMWIWYVSRSNGGTLSSIISNARRYGISTLIIKSSDGPTMWSQFNPSVVSTFHANGLRVCAWQYVYGNHPLLEAQAAAQAVHDGADCLVIDAESEYEGKYVAAQSYITQLRKLIGQTIPVALAGFPVCGLPPRLPVLGVPRPGRRSVQHATDVLGRHRHQRRTRCSRTRTRTTGLPARHRPARAGLPEPTAGSAHPLPPAFADLRGRRRLVVGLAAGHHLRLEGDIDRRRQPDRHPNRPAPRS